jgi:hypothetical protein
MIKVASGQNSKDTDWLKKITDQEKADGNRIKSLLNKSHKIDILMAASDTYIIEPGRKSDRVDSHEIAISDDSNSKTEVFTDGTTQSGRCYKLGEIPMKSQTVINFNYIVLKQHLPSHSKNVSDIYYQSVICNSWGLKLYVQYLLGYPLG